MDTVEVGGVTYVSTQDAAKAVGYTVDYVGQLCRKDKVDARQIGRTWYVKEGALEAHKKGAARSNKQKTRESVTQAHIESAREPGHIHKSMYMPEYKKRLLDTEISYQSDSHPLMPNVARSEASAEEETEVEEVESAASEKEALAAAQRDVEASYEEEAAEERDVTVRIATEEAEVVEEEVVPVSSSFDIEYAEDIVPDREYTRPRGGGLISATVLAGILFFVLATAFVQNLWTYQAGSSVVTQQLYLETTYSVSAVASVIESLSR